MDEVAGGRWVGWNVGWGEVSGEGCGVGLGGKAGATRWRILALPQAVAPCQHRRTSKMSREGWWMVHTTCGGGEARRSGQAG